MSNYVQNEANRLKKQLNYDLSSYQERAENLNQVLEDPFISEYYEKYDDVFMEKENELHTDSPMGKSLEDMATYLLMAEEEQEYRKNKQTEYKMFTDRRHFKKALAKQETIGQLTGDNQDSEVEDNVLYFLEREEQNYKLDKQLEIKQTDIDKNDEIGSILSDYQAYMDALETMNIAQQQKNEFKGSIKQDMLITKESLSKMFGQNMTSSNETSSIDIDYFDFTNIRHLKGDSFLNKYGQAVKAKGLLYFEPYLAPDDDFSAVLTDLQRVIDRAILDVRDLRILELMRKEYKQKEIAELLEVDASNISRAIDRIARNVARVGETYDKKEESYEISQTA